MAPEPDQELRAALSKRIVHAERFDSDFAPEEANHPTT